MITAKVRGPGGESVPFDETAALFVSISYARPEVEALTWWSLSDTPSYIPAAGLVRADGTPKEALSRLKELEKSWGIHFGK